MAVPSWWEEGMDWKNISRPDQLDAGDDKEFGI